MSSDTRAKAGQRFSAALDHIAAGRYHDALTDLSKAVFLNPNAPEYYKSRAETYLLLCDFKSAVMNFKKAILLRPEDKPAQRQVAAVYGKCRSSSSSSSSSIGRNSSSSSSSSSSRGHEGLWLCEYHMVYCSREHPSTHLLPCSTRPIYICTDLLGHTYLQKHDWGQARVAFSNAIDLDALVPYYWLHRCFAFVGSNDLEAAVQDATRCLSLDHENVDVLVVRARIYAMLGDVCSRPVMPTSCSRPPFAPPPAPAHHAAIQCWLCAHPCCLTHCLSPLLPLYP
eukprot:TRINITY_DN2701_c0_g1_i2.p1 TRINITY_DN2701_c0_g1~~TRINITY_DN2701_c0_g1_i2.p1  ORF type:complete len:283 (+),score=33.39 TRINITY_DN2701_c0_g1_i2:104-952(+)